MFQLLGAEEANECNPLCNGLHLSTIPPNMRSLLPRGYSMYLLDNNTLGLGGVSPRRGRIRSEAARAHASQGEAMKRSDNRHMGRELVVGAMV